MKNRHNVFPNELNGRNIVATVNTVWAMDFTSIKATLENQPKIQLKLFLVIDLCTNEILLAKAFKTNKGGCISAKLIVNQLQSLLKVQSIKEPIILHSDRGAEFLSNQYQEFIRNNKLLIGSMSKTAQPTDNAIVERAFRTFKSQLTEGPKLESKYKSFYYAQLSIQKRVDFFNNKHLPKKAHGITPRLLRQKLTTSNKDKPTNLLHWNNKHDAITQEIQVYKKQVAQSPIELLQQSATNSLAAAEISSIVNQKIDFLKEEIHQRFDKLEQIKAKKIKRRTQPLRIPADNTIYQYLMSLKRPKRYQKISWSRHRIAITLLFYLGLRANELQQIDENLIKQGLTKQQIQLFQPKTNQYRIIAFTERLCNVLNNELNLDRRIVFAKDTDKLLTNSKDGSKTIRPEYWIRSLNKFLNLAKKHFNNTEILTSHSFRINYITSLLRTVPIQKVKHIIGHKNIETTSRYDRFLLDYKDVSKLVDQALKT